MIPGTYVEYRATSPPKKTQNAWYQRGLRCQLRGRPFHPWAGRPRFSGEAHPGPATLTQSSVSLVGPASKVKPDCCCAVLPWHVITPHNVMYTAVYMLLMLLYSSRCCVRFRALDQLLQPHQTVLWHHLPRARPSLGPHNRWRLQAGGREQWTVLSGTSTIGHGLHVADRAQVLTGT